MRVPYFIGGSHPAQSPVVSTERTVNWYPEKPSSPGAKAAWVLYPTPGVEVAVDSGLTSAVRGMLVVQGWRPLVVIGNVLYEMTALDALTSRMSLAVSAFSLIGGEPATVSYNGDGGLQVFITSGTVGYCYELSPPSGFISDATNVWPVVITSNNHGLANGQSVVITGVVGNTAANGTWVISAVTPNTFAINATGNGAYVSGGLWQRQALQPAVAAGCDMGTMVDGYFVYLNRTLSQFHWSALNDGLEWPALNWQGRSAQADRWLALKAMDRQLWLFGSETTEVWYNQGDATQPFMLHPSGQLPFGIIAPYSAQVVGGTMIWLSRTQHGVGAVVQCSGFTPRIISTQGQHATWGASANLDDALAFTYEQDGHVFYVLTFVTDDRTWVYDLTTEQWHERGTGYVANGVYHKWRPMHHMIAFDQHLVGDIADGVVFKLGSSYLSDVGGEWIRRSRIGSILSHENKRLFFSRLTVDLEVANANVAVPDPSIGLRYSNDAGRTWTSARSMATGATGQYLTRVNWNRLGSARNRVFELVTPVASAAVPWRVIDAYVEMHPGAQGR